MAVDYSKLAFPKSRVKALDKQDQVKAREAQDKTENAKAKKRAQGRCEVREVTVTNNGHMEWRQWRFCPRKDTQTHHLKGGIGRRNRGDSILAINKLRVCAECHDAITKNILKPTTAEHDAATVRFWRAR